MNLEQQVCSLELAKRLKELGIKQESLFCHQPIKNEKPRVWPRNFNLNEFAHPSIDERIAAFTLIELLEILPNRITININEPFNSFILKIEKSFHVEQYDIDKGIFDKKDMYIANYHCDSTAIVGHDAWMRRCLTDNKWDHNAANSCAKMLIYLLENRLIKNETNIS